MPLRGSLRSRCAARATAATLRFASGAVANLASTCLLRWNHRVGLHVFSDAMALVLAFGARKLAQRPATPEWSFGWSRSEILAAFVNYIALIAVSYEPGPRTASLISGVAPSSEICTST